MIIKSHKTYKYLGYYFIDLSLIIYATLVNVFSAKHLVEPNLDLYETSQSLILDNPLKFLIYALALEVLITILNIKMFRGKNSNPDSTRIAVYCAFVFLGPILSFLYFTFIFKK